jgi:integrase
VCSLLYGGGLRLLEAVQLRVKDIDLDRREIMVRRGKGQKDRRTVLPGVLVDRLRAHLQTVHKQHDGDLSLGAGFVALPFALDGKYPNASREWNWQWVFPATRTYTDPATREVRRDSGFIRHCSPPRSSKPEHQRCKITSIFRLTRSVTGRHLR